VSVGIHARKVSNRVPLDEHVTYFGMYRERSPHYYTVALCCTRYHPNGPTVFSSTKKHTTSITISMCLASLCLVLYSTAICPIIIVLLC
jgi:hypothetical protein